MTTRLDHTILDVADLDESVAFYRDVLGFHHDRSGAFEVMLVNDDTAVDLRRGDDPESRHLAFAMDRATFDAAFARIRDMGVTYGDGPGRLDTMRGPGRSSGVHGRTWSVYFRDPSGHVLEILTYDDAE